jgi:histidine triad (HIT) family protein
MMDCIFCRIVDGKIPSDIVYQDEEVLAFRDINPQAPVHLLIIPKKHFTSLAHLTENDALLIGHMVSVANRLVINCGQQGGQLVPHLHMHVLGGRQLAGHLG